MKYISTDSDSDNYDIKHGQFTENPLRGSTTRYVANPIVDNIEAAPEPDEQYVPPDCHVVGEPSVNNLATHRWRDGGLDAATEARLIRRVQDGDRLAFRQLLEAFHRSVVGPASRYVPGGAFERRQPKNTKHTNAILFEDLTSVGCVALWQSALRFKPGHRFNTLSRHKIVGAISNEANHFRRRGYSWHCNRYRAIGTNLSHYRTDRGN